MAEIIIKNTPNRNEIFITIDARFKETIPHNEKIKITEVSNNEKRVSDVFRYIVRISRGGIDITSTNGDLFEFNDSPTTASQNNKIILIIESPHKDEYTCDFLPKAPAQGATGRKILSNLRKLIIKLNILIDGEFDLIISNPVQFQSSLYNLHRIPLSDSRVKSIRNAAWRSLYLTGEKENFIQRINGYSPFLIINACTHELRKKVTRTLQNDILHTTVPIFECSHHPCMWDQDFSLTPVHR